MKSWLVAHSVCKAALGGSQLHQYLRFVLYFAACSLLQRLATFV